MSGAVVRLTPPAWAATTGRGAATRRSPEKGGHAAIEFGNRMVALVGIVLDARSPGSPPGAWPRLPGCVRKVALVTALGTVAQIPSAVSRCSSICIRSLVMSHFLLALLVLAGAVVVALEAWIHAPRPRPARRPILAARRRARSVLAACAALVVTGTVATASGPHSGGQDIRRLGLGDHRHRVRPRSRDRRLRDRASRRRHLPLAPATGLPGHRSGRARAARRARSCRWSWARSSTATRCPGGSSSSTSRSRRRSGR